MREGDAMLWRQTKRMPCVKTYNTHNTPVLKVTTHNTPTPESGARGGWGGGASNLGLPLDSGVNPLVTRQEPRERALRRGNGDVGCGCLQLGGEEEEERKTTVSTDSFCGRRGARDNVVLVAVEEAVEVVARSDERAGLRRQAYNWHMRSC